MIKFGEEEEKKADVENAGEEEYDDEYEYIYEEEEEEDEPPETVIPADQKLAVVKPPIQPNSGLGMNAGQSPKKVNDFND